MKRRKVDITVISDAHLGSALCHADELLTYLSSIQPKTLILNGNIFDINISSKNDIPKTHYKVVRKIMTLSIKGTEVYYIGGEKDNLMRKFCNTSIGNIHVKKDLSLDLNGRRAWFIHGDLFATAHINISWLANFEYMVDSMLSLFNRSSYYKSKILIKKRRLIAKRTKGKEHTKAILSTINRFEKSVANKAIRKGYDYVVCGHTKHPKKFIHETANGSCIYLNSGDWVENLTALEYSLKRWKVYRYNHDKLSPFFMDEELKKMNMQDLIDSIVASKSNRENEQGSSLSDD